MKIEIVNVTPKLASDWLKKNTNNRPLRRAVVDGFKQALLRGEYKTTHQGIAFSNKGVLLDGQHRLTAISEMKDGSYPMLVAKNVSPEAFLAMDIGVKRSAADVLHEDKLLVEVARLAANIGASHKTRGHVTPTMLIPFVERIEPIHSALRAFAPTPVRTWTSAPVRLAAVVSVLKGIDIDHVKAVYRSLATSDFSGMSPVARALYKAYVGGTFRIQDRLDALTRLLIVFDPDRENQTRFNVKDTSQATAAIREVFFDIFAEQTIHEEEKEKPSKAGGQKVFRPSIVAHASR